MYSIFRNMKKEFSRPTKFVQNSIPLKGTFMITINCSLDNITQDNYDNIVNNLSLNALKCPICFHSDFVIHGYYSRSLKTPAGIITLKILRVRCRACGSTHAVLLSSIVPYSTVPLYAHIIITSGGDYDQLMNDVHSIDESNISYIRRMFNSFWKQKLLSENIFFDDLLSFNCFSLFHRQFMQIKCTSNILFSPST